MTIDEKRPVFGGRFAIDRFNRNRGAVEWKIHCTYFKVKIFRAYSIISGTPLALYAAFPADSITPKWHMDCNLVCETLVGIKALVRQVIE